MRALKLKLKKMWSILLRLLPKKRYQTVLGLFFGSFVIVGLVISVSPAQAQWLSITDVGNGIIDGMSKVFLAFARVGIGLTVFGLRMFMELAAYNNYINSPPVVVGWFMVRDVANMFFVVALLVIAFGTILGLEQYEWRKALAKLVLAAILINFSRLICGLIIDAAHVFTITFLNAVQGAAGGNLINMFKLDKILSLSQTAPGGEIKEDLRLDLFVASITAMFFAILAMVTVGAYVVVMVARVIVLWVAIIMSPLAFVLQSIPQTKSYATDWWQEFTKHVLAAPLMVFFLWLAFATLGSGDISNHVGIKSLRQNSETQSLEVLSISSTPSTSLSEISSWENMSSFFIAMAFLMIGLQRVQKLGVTGGSSAVGSALSIGKKIATVASGYAAGRYLANKGLSAGKSIALAPINGAGKLAKKAAGAIAYRLPGIGGRALKRQWAGAKLWAADTGEGFEYTVDKDGKKVLAKDKDGKLIPKTHDRGIFQRAAHSVLKRDMAENKKLKKTEDAAKVRLDILDKQTKGIPTYWLQGEHEEGVDALDRVEQGILEAEKERSKGKTEEFSGLGKQATLGQARFKDGKREDPRERGTLQDQVSAHKTQAATIKAQMDASSGGSDMKFALTAGGTIAIQRKEEAAQQAKAATEYLATMSEEEKRSFLQTDEGQAVLARRTKAEERKKLAEAEVKRLKADSREDLLSSPQGLVLRDLQQSAEQELKTIEDALSTMTQEDKERFLATAPGTAMLEQQAQAKERKKLADEGIKGLEEGSRKDFLNTREGRALRKQQQAAEQEVKTIEGELSKMNEQDKRVFLATDAGKNLLDRQQKAQEVKKLLGAQIGRLEGESKEEFYDGPAGKNVMRQLNIAEQGAKAAEEFVKTLKDKELGKEFVKAAKEMQGWIAKGGVDLKDAVRDASQTGYSNVFVRALGQAQLAAEEKKDAQVVEQQASDAAHDSFVHIPRYGTTSASNALTQLSEAKMKEYKLLDRAAGAEKAAETMAHLSNIDPDDLSIGQRAELYAATDFVTSEAWNDDQMAYIYAQFEKLKKGGLDTDPGKKTSWMKMAEKFKNIGLLDSFDTNTGTFTGTINKPNNRKTASALQNLGISGNDDGLIRAHNLTQAKMEEMNDRRASVAVRAARAMSITDEKELEKIGKQARTVTYDKAAQQVLPAAGITGISSWQDMRARYEKNGDFMQDATRNFKKHAAAAGHQQMGYNQDYDDTLGIYRFQGEKESEDKMYAERAKQKSRNLINTDQHHTNGTLDMEFNILDDFIEKALSVSIGRATKAIELTDMPLRSLYSHYYMNKDEDPKTVTKEVDGKKHTRAVLGGDIIHDKVAADYDKKNGPGEFKKLNSEKKQEVARDHMLTRGVMTQLLSGNGGLGWALGLTKAYGHIDERQAQKGIVDLQIEGKDFVDVEALVNGIKAAITSVGVENIPEYKHYKGKEKELEARLDQVVRVTAERRKQYEAAEKVPKAPKKETDAEDEAALGATETT